MINDNRIETSTQSHQRQDRKSTYGKYRDFR